MPNILGAMLHLVRTTATIDDDLGQVLRDFSRHCGHSFKTIVNEMLRRSLMSGKSHLVRSEPSRVRPSTRGFLPGIDPRKVNQLADELESARYLEQDHHGPSETRSFPTRTVLLGFLRLISIWRVLLDRVSAVEAARH